MNYYLVENLYVRLYVYMFVHIKSVINDCVKSE